MTPQVHIICLHKRLPQFQACDCIGKETATCFRPSLLHGTGRISSLGQCVDVRPQSRRHTRWLRIGTSPGTPAGHHPSQTRGNEGTRIRRGRAGLLRCDAAGVFKRMMAAASCKIWWSGAGRNKRKHKAYHNSGLSFSQKGGFSHPCSTLRSQPKRGTSHSRQ